MCARACVCVPERDKERETLLLRHFSLGDMDTNNLNKRPIKMDNDRYSELCPCTHPFWSLLRWQPRRMCTQSVWRHNTTDWQPNNESPYSKIWNQIKECQREIWCKAKIATCACPHFFFFPFYTVCNYTHNMIISLSVHVNRLLMKLESCAHAVLNLKTCPGLTPDPPMKPSWENSRIIQSSSGCCRAKFFMVVK